VSIVSKSNLSPLKHDRRSNASWREHVFVDVSNGRYYCRICVTATDICNSTLTLKGWAGNASSSTAIIKHVQKEHDQKLPQVRTRVKLKSVRMPSSLSRKDRMDQLLGAAIATSSITPWTLENDYFKNWVHELNPEYNLPGRTKITGVIESMSAACRTATHKDFEKCKSH
jgi:hypothetical protein